MYYSAFKSQTCWTNETGKDNLKIYVFLVIRIVTMEKIKSKDQNELENMKVVLFLDQ